MSGLRDVWLISGYCIFLPTSAWSVQSLACCWMPYFFVLLVDIFFDEWDEGDVCVSRGMFLLLFVLVLICGRALLRPYNGVICIFLD